jgi:hypothetical protein
MARNETTSPFQKGRFILPKNVPAFTWEPPMLRSDDPEVADEFIHPPEAGGIVNPAEESYSCARLLLENAFIDKSAALYNLLFRRFDSNAKDFGFVPLLLVYPRRFAKTTLLGFIEAVFTPVPTLGNYHMNEVRTKIAALKWGKKLLDFGWRPVVCLDLQNIETVAGLKEQIESRLGRAGLKEADLEALMASSTSPEDLLYDGVRKLNKNFTERFGIKRKTIVMIDEYDKLFRDRDIDDYQEKKDTDTETAREKKRTIAALFRIFGFAKEASFEGVSLLVLCGITRMMGSSGLSKVNNLVDVSRWTIYHGLCGISAREFVNCASGRLDGLAKEIFNVKNFEELLVQTFIPEWDGFRFGLDTRVGHLNPEFFDGALFSPLDVWAIVQLLVEKHKVQSSVWTETMKSEFEFTRFAARYISSGDAGFFELYRNLQGGWINTANPGYNMDRNKYLLLENDLNVQKVLFELGLLSVKDISHENAMHERWVRLGSTNWTVTRNALRLLVGIAQHGTTTEELARAYLGDNANGFGNIMVSAAREVSNKYRATRKDVVNEYPFQDYLFMELLFRFPEGRNGFPLHYKISKEVRVAC